MTNHEEQRKHPRVNSELPIVAKPIRKTQFEGTILSLSEGGAFLATEENLPTGSEVVLFLTLETSGKRKSGIAQGKVVWANHESDRGAVGCGIAFDDSSPSLHRLIGEFVEFKKSGKVTAMGVAETVGGTRARGRGQLRG
jgi:Tfp pilus assembly protein PilZ